MKTLILLGGTLWLTAAPAAALNVRAVPLDEVLYAPVYSAPATVVARNQPQIAAEIDARVIALPVQVGDRVSTDDTLALLDCRVYESRLAVARAQLKVARAQLAHASEQLKRARNLKKNKSISDELLDQRRTDLETRQAEASVGQETVNQAAIDVGHCIVKAPFDAVVTDRLVSTGSHVAHGKAVIGLLETSGQEVSAYLRESEIARLQEPDQLVFEATAGRFPLQLRTLLPAISTATRTREVRLAFAGEAAIPGTPGRILWHGKRLMLPADYLVRREPGLGIFVLRDGQAHFVALPQAQEGQPSELSLPADTRLITEGRRGLADGQAVDVTPAREQP